MLTSNGDVVDSDAQPPHHTIAYKGNQVLARDRDKLRPDIMIVELSATEQASYGSANNHPNLGRLKPRMQDNKARISLSC